MESDGKTRIFFHNGIENPDLKIRELWPDADKHQFSGEGARELIQRADYSSVEGNSDEICYIYRLPEWHECQRVEMTEPIEAWYETLAKEVDSIHGQTGATILFC